jgi:hypothetical protein
MKNQKECGNRLYEIEQEVMAEGREWMKERLQEKLQKEADRDGEVFPPQRGKADPSAAATDAPAHRRRSR